MRIRTVLSLLAIPLVCSVMLSCTDPDSATDTSEIAADPADPATNAPEMPATGAPQCALASRSGVDWFNNGLGVDPLENKLTFDSNCAFHQWTWQTFLWLMRKSEQNGVLMLSLKGPGALYPNWSQKPVLVRGRKTDEQRSIDDIRQAISDGLLVDQNGHVTYYSMFINDRFDNFISANKLNETQTLLNVTNTISFADNGAESGLEMPNGTDSVELKASWKILTEDDDPSQYITTQADVSKLKNDVATGRIVVDSDDTWRVTLAMVGLHVVGAVAGHPEMIWGTLEHVENAPDVPFDVKKIQDDADDDKKPDYYDKVISDKDFTFYKGGTKFKDCNVNAQGLTLNENSQTLSPITQVCRIYATGGQADKDNDKDNGRNIEELNSSIWSAIEASEALPVLKNYKEIGAVWFDDVSKFSPNSPLVNTGAMTGSVNLSNATIETFTQLQSSTDNCFACHNTLQNFPPSEMPNVARLPGKNLSISHILVQGFFREADASETN